MARAIYREWFVQFRFPGHETRRSSTPPWARSQKAGVSAALASTICNGEHGRVARRQSAESLPASWSASTSAPADHAGRLGAGRRLESRRGATLASQVTSSGRNDSTDCRAQQSASLLDRRDLRRPAIAVGHYRSRGRAVAVRCGIELVGRSSPDFATATSRCRVPTGSSSGDFSTSSVPPMRPGEAVSSRPSDSRCDEPDPSTFQAIGRYSACQLRDLLLPKLVTGQIDVSSARPRCARRGSAA